MVVPVLAGHLFITAMHYNYTNYIPKVIRFTVHNCVPIGFIQPLSFLQGGNYEVSDDYVIVDQGPRPRKPRNYEMPVSPTTNGQSVHTPLLPTGHYEVDENYNQGLIPNNSLPTEEYDKVDGPQDYTEIDETAALQEYSEIDESAMQREYSEIDDDFNEGGGYKAVPKEFQSPPPVKMKPNGRHTKSEVFETFNASDLDTGPSAWRGRSRTISTPPREEYETPIDAVERKVQTLRHNPPPQFMDYETPIDAA